MTIHHDKMAYGRLAATQEELSEERLLEMLELLAEESEGADEEQNKSGEVQSCRKKEK